MKTQHLFIFVFLLIVAAIAIFTSTAAKAATINVDDSGGKDYTNIQDAINASSIGDTVYVYNGTYYEHLMINKTLSLVGENQSNTTIDGGSTGALITINADYVNVSGFLMRNSGSTGSDAAVKITTTANYSTITYNTMIDTIYGVSVDTGSYNNISHNNIINSISGLTIQWSIHNTVTYNNITNSNYYGLYLGYSSYNNVTSNNASNNGWYGIGLASGSLYSATNYNTINYNTVTNNTLDGIYLYSASNNDIRYNNIYDNKQNGMRVDVNCADTGNTVAGSWWGNASGPYNDTANPSGTGDNITLGITFSPWALSLIDIYAAQPPTQLSIRNITVSASGGKDYTMIQDAINASNNGDMVYVYNGTYYENLTINKTINLVGESNQSTIIKGTGASDSKGIYVTANYVNISNLKIDNFSYGIYLDYSSNNIITGNTITNCSGYYGGIYLYSSSNNTIAGNTVANCSYGIYLSSGSNNTIIGNTLAEGIRLDSTSAATATLQNNTVGGKPLYFAKNIDSTANPTYIENSTYGQVILYNCSGFVIRNNNFNRAILFILSGSNNNIAGNTVANCSYGIRLDSSSNNNTITSNKITNGSYGIYLQSSSNNTIVSNIIMNNSDRGVDLYSGSNNNVVASNTIINNSYGILLYSSSNNVIESNTIINNSNYGIRLDYQYSSNNNITLNTITNNGNCGIYLYYGSNNVITLNNIYNNKQYGLYLYSSTGNTAYNNWWGNITGPHNTNSNPIGTGDNITDGVPFAPWATSPFFTTTAITPPTLYVGGIGSGNYTTIQNAINASNLGDTIFVYNGTYNEQIIINKSANLVGQSARGVIIQYNGTLQYAPSGIHVVDASHVNISNISIDNFYYGISLYNCNNVSIVSTIITNCDGHGIRLDFSSNNSIMFNTISDSQWGGIILNFSSNNNIMRNTVTNLQHGINIGYSSNNAIISNVIANNGYDGIFIISSSNNIILSNDIFGNKQYGLYVTETTSQSTNNTATNNWWGDVSGPHHETRNPSGKGDTVSGDIDFIPWANSSFNPPEIPISSQNNTKIISPTNKSVVSGIVLIKTEVLMCECNGKTSLYVDSVWINNGTLNGTTTHDGRYYEYFYNGLNTSTLANGWHTLKMYGKHTEYFDEIRVYVNNTIAVVNHPPIIINVTANRTTVEAGEQVTITVTASDVDGNILNYMYEAAGITNLGNESNAVWTAPTTSGTYTISIKVNDSKSESDVMTINITVLPISQPSYFDFVTISSLATDKSSYTTGEKIRVTVISQRGSDMLTVVWDGNVTLKVLNSNGAEVFGMVKNVSIPNGGGNSTTYFDLILNDIGNYTIETTLSGMFDVLSAKGVSIIVKAKTDGGGGTGFIPGFELLTLIAGLVVAIISVRKSKARREKI